MEKSTNDKPPSQSKNFFINYQNAFNNYTAAQKYYINNLQIKDSIEKIINSYKDTILLFKKKLIQIKLSLVKTLYIEEKKCFKFAESIYSYNNNFIFLLNQILTYQIDSITNLINDIEKKVFCENNKKNLNDYVYTIQQNKNNIQSNQKKMEKMFSEYNSEYSKFTDTFYGIEEEVKMYYYKQRKKQLDETEISLLNEYYNEASNAHSIFLTAHNKFQDNNKKFFEFYNNKMKEYEEEVNKSDIQSLNIINSFISAIMNNKKNLLKCMDDMISKNKLNIQENVDINNIKNKNNIKLFLEKYITSLEENYMNEKYKVKAIHSQVLDDKISQENKEVLNILNDELGLEDFQDTSHIVLVEEDVFQITKFFHGSFEYVDTSEYNFPIEKKKLDVKKLTNKLLQFGLIKKEAREFKDLKPINDNEIKKLTEYLKSKKEYRNSFLLRFNYFRTLGIFDLPEKEFNIIANYFEIITDCILNERDENDFTTLKLMIILSQTFYINKDGQKMYLINTLKGHKLFNDIEFIKIYLNSLINEEIGKSEDKSKVKLNSKSKMDIIFATMLPFCNYMLEFGIEKDKLLEINESIYKKYELKEDLIKNINMIIESK